MITRLLLRGNFLSLFTFLLLSSSAQTLSLGDLAIIGVGVDDEEVLVVALENIPSGETVFFTDEEWAGSAFSSGEGFYSWVTPAISAGTVFSITTTGTSVGGAVNQQAGSFALSNNGDGVFLYQTSTNTYNSGSYNLLSFAGEEAGDAGTLSGTGLTLGNGAVYFGGDNGIYAGTRTGQSKATYLSLIYNSSNWSTSGSPQTFDFTFFTFLSSGPELQLENSAGGNESCGYFIDFGAVIPSTTQTQTFDITNTGTSDLDISSLSLTGTAFSILSPATPFSVASGASQTVTIQYSAPASPTLDLEILTITSNDTDEGSCVVNLSGESGSPNYCTVSGNTNFQTSITDVSFAGNTNPSSLNGADDPSGYIEFSSPSFTVDVGNAYNLDVNLNTDGNFDVYAKAWIDWNHDFDFDDPDEEFDLGVATNVSNGPTDLSPLTINVPLTANIGSTRMRIVCRYNVDPAGPCAGSDDGEIEDYTVIISNSCTPTHSVSSFFPTSGPEGTLVTINGTGFSAATTVNFNGSSAAIVNQTSTDLAVEVPNGASDGSLNIVDPSACALDAGAFDFLDEDNCSNIPAGWGGELLISGVYDESGGSCHYVQIFNPNSFAVDLSEYFIGSDNNQSNANNPFPASFNGGTATLSGTIQAQSTVMVRSSGGGSQCNSCTSITPDLTFTSFGYNAGSTQIDRLWLMRQPNVPVDLWAQGFGFPNTGYVYARNSSSTAPSLTYSNSDWDAQNTADCFGFEVQLETPPSASTINDIASCFAEFSLTATAGVAGASLTYQWYFHDGTSSTWNMVNSSNLPGYQIIGANSNTLEIASSSANTTALDNYQFHCEIIQDGVCTKYSNAAQFTLETEDFFRSVSSGNNDWDDLDVWEIATSTAGPWRPACVYPTSGNSTYISIENGTAVNIPEGIGSPDASASQLIIQVGGSLSIEGNAEFEIDNGQSGADLIVEGTLIDNANSGSGNGINFLNSATWSIANSGTFIKTSNSSVASNMRDQYEGGIDQISAGATWIYRRTSTAGLISTVAAGMYYPNLIIENQSGSPWDMGNFTEAFTGGTAATSTMVVKGDLSIGATGDAVTAYFNNLSSEFLRVDGDLNIGAGSILSNDSYDGGTNTQRGDGSGIKLLGDFEVAGTLDFTHNDANATAGQVEFNGTGGQIGVGSGTISARVLTVNSPGDILADMEFEVDEVLNLTNGILELDNDLNSVALADGITVNGGSNSSHIDGFVSKPGSTDFWFPVGDEGYYQPVQVKTISAPSTFRARYVAMAHPEAGPWFDGSSGSFGNLEEIGNCDFWTVDLTSGTGSANVNLTYGENPCNDISPIGASFLNIAKWDGSFWEYPIIGVDVSTFGEISSTTPFSTFSDFVLASTDGENAVLPITLLSFQAKAVDGLVRTQWITATEINNDFFTIERSKDGQHWESVGTVDGAGDSNTELSYSFVDDAPYYGISYYRLRQTDFDGKTTVSDPRAVEIKEGDAFGLDRVYRGQEGLNLVYRSNAPYLTVEIYDMLGKRIHTEMLENAGSGFATLYPDLARGAYVLRLSHGSAMDSEKFVY